MRYHLCYVCRKNELYLRMKLKTDIMTKFPEENQEDYILRKKNQMKRIPGINHHGQIRKSFHYPGENWRILAEWQIQLVPPFRNVFHIPENFLLENAIWPLGLNNLDIVANQQLVVMVLIMAVAMSLTIIQEEQNQQNL